MGLQEIKANIVDYFKGVKTEWGKITWPTKDQVKIETGIVILIVFLFTLYILILDKVFLKIFQFIHLG